MKKKYISPEMDIIEFDTKDVITTSGIGGGGQAANEEMTDASGNINGSNTDYST